jgi:hypothetical protein
MNSAGPISVDYVTGTPPGPTQQWPLALGCEDAEAEFWVQADAFAVTQAGLLVNLVDAAPDPIYRQSRQSITSGATGTQFRIMGLVNSPADNAYGANARVFVRLMQSYQN